MAKAETTTKSSYSSKFKERNSSQDQIKDNRINSIRIYASGKEEWIPSTDS